MDPYSDRPPNETKGKRMFSLQLNIDPDKLLEASDKAQKSKKNKKNKKKGKTKAKGKQSKSAG